VQDSASGDGSHRSAKELRSQASANQFLDVKNRDNLNDEDRADAEALDKLRSATSKGRLSALS